jgi:hypothetical protein
MNINMSNISPDEFVEITSKLNAGTKCSTILLEHDLTVL